MQESLDQTAVALSLQDITCTFVSNEDKKSAYTAVKDTSLHIKEGEFVSVVGPTGCGKSTLLNISAGLLQPTKGQVKVFGKELQGINTRAGYMFQGEALFPWRNAIDNICAGLHFANKPEKESKALARDWLLRVGLEHAEDKFPHQMSGGMRKRVMLAQTLIRDPDIILMDEPFSALDIQTRQLMENELLDIWMSKRKAVLFITHDLDEAIAMSDRVVILAAGPGTHVIGEFVIDLPRPRDVAEVRNNQRFVELHQAIWDVLKEEVLKGYRQQKRK